MRPDRRIDDKFLYIANNQSRMARSSPSRSQRKGDNADVSYDIDLPFSRKDATIYLFDEDDGTVEVLIGNVPEPLRYYINYNSSDRDIHDQHAVARWILDDASHELKKWDYKTSSYKTNNPNYHFQDVYFKCDIEELNEAVLAAKRFLSSIEEKVIRQRSREERDYPTSPQQLLK